MRKTAIALLATTLITSGAFAASDKYQQPKGAQTQLPKQDQSQQTTQDQVTPPSNNEQTTKNSEPVLPLDLSQGQVEQVQQALDKEGFKTGATDGRWGPRSENALKRFQESKQIQPKGQLDQRTFADLGLDASIFVQPQK